MRFSDVGIRALRSGFGVFRGVGGSLEDLDELNKSARRVGLTYGYLEGEYAFSNFTALIARGVIGLRDDGVSTGAQAMIRLGSDRGHQSTDWRGSPGWNRPSWPSPNSS